MLGRAGALPAATNDALNHRRDACVTHVHGYRVAGSVPGHGWPTWCEPGVPRQIGDDRFGAARSVPTSDRGRASSGQVTLQYRIRSKYADQLWGRRVYLCERLLAD